MIYGILALIFLLHINTTWANRQTPAPNIVLVLTDDQDIELHGLHPLQETVKLFRDQGTSFTNAYTSTPLCCPSRASILTGQYAHNHRTFNNSLDGGCNDRSWQKTSEPRALPVLLKKHGYQTFYGGKYLNHYNGAAVPPGWDEFHGLHGNSRYYNYTLRENAQNRSYTDTYLTDLLAERVVEFIRNAKVNEPFFAMVSPPAAHAPFTPAPRHDGIFASTQALRTPSFNFISKDKHWLVGSGKPFSNSTILTVDKYFQKRWETLLAVDEMMMNLVAVLKETQSFENTFIIYTSDNGYHVGQFAQPFDKRQPYQTDIRVPLLIRGPGVPAGHQVHMGVSLIDLMPTILDWTDIPVPDYIDGRSFKGELQLEIDGPERVLLVEYWGEGNDDTYNPECPWDRTDRLAECTLDADCHCQDAWNNTYTCLRDFRYKLDRVFCEFEDNENFIEAYDLIQDPYQLTNIGYDLLPIERALYKILLQNLTKCAGKTCQI